MKGMKRFLGQKPMTEDKELIEGCYQNLVVFQ